ncbi:unnamed protein product [Prunus armeniaca]|uniref:Uncharacterized protein n=1 Tax=Prunus armeniaca TaxID=36596 RepID=A0A6J5X735_PRUAR|nr:unnamed protein product [Prunus armeniaca]CAB4308393.1 unnamed protein product [Prunus armeniaca]
MPVPTVVGVWLVEISCTYMGRCPTSVLPILMVVGVQPECISCTYVVGVQLMVSACTYVSRWPASGYCLYLHRDYSVDVRPVCVLPVLILQTRVSN